MTFVFKHPKYYKELRSRNKLDQAISLRKSETSAGERSPGPGLKLQAREDSTANSTRGLSGVRPGPGLKQQASSPKLEAASDKQQAPSNKLK